MDRFQKEVIAKSVCSAIMEGTPISNSWGFPNFLLENEEMLAAFFGEKVYSIYNTLSEQEKRDAIEWYEISGAEINVMTKSTAWEDDETSFSIDCVHFAASQPEYYRATVAKLVEAAYGQLSEDTQKIIYDKFTSEPRVFQDEIDRNK